MMRVLALVPGGIGDQLLFFPTLDTLKQQYPQAQIDVVVEPRSASAYRVCPLVKTIWKFDFKDSNSLADWGNLLGNIREQEYDAVISLGQRFSVGLFLWLTGIPSRISFDGSGNIFLTEAVPLNADQYAASMYHDLLKGLGIDLPCPPMKINVPKGDLDWVSGEQKRLGVKDSGYILLHGGSSNLAKRKGIDKIYPPESWATVLQELQKKIPNLPIVAVQGPEDAAFIADLRKQLPQLLVTSPPDIGKLAATIAAANLMLCTDSAPMHLGVAVGTALVALFGPTDPAKLLPPNSEQKIKAIKAPNGRISAIAPQDIVAKLFSK